jgi:hypothetical protein
MARIELEIDDTKGEIVGDVPEPLKGIFSRIENTTYQQAFGKGAAKAADEAKAQIAKAVADEKARLEAEAPLRAEKYQRMEDEYKTLQTRLLEQEREHDRTVKTREENHARELLDRSDRLKKFGGRIMDLTKSQLRGEARAAGARDESLDELEVILHSSIGYTDDMEPYIKNGDGTPRTVQGKPMSLNAFVKEYLDGHTHHRRPTAGAGGGARGGASFHGQSHSNVSAEAARARIESGDRSAGAINELFEASRRKSA